MNLPRTVQANDKKNNMIKTKFFSPGAQLWISRWQADPFSDGIKCSWLCARPFYPRLDKTWVVCEQLVLNCYKLCSDFISRLFCIYKNKYIIYLKIPGKEHSEGNRTLTIALHAQFGLVLMFI